MRGCVVAWRLPSGRAPVGGRRPRALERRRAARGLARVRCASGVGWWIRRATAARANGQDGPAALDEKSASGESRGFLISTAPVSFRSPSAFCAESRSTHAPRAAAPPDRFLCNKRLLLLAGLLLRVWLRIIIKLAADVDRQNSVAQGVSGCSSLTLADVPFLGIDNEIHFFHASFDIFEVLHTIHYIIQKKGVDRASVLVLHPPPRPDLRSSASSPRKQPR